MDQNIRDQKERREARRKRRIRNQIMAYATVIVFLLLFAAGIVFGVQYLTQESKKNESEKQEQVQQMIGTEESLSEMEPESSTEPESTSESVAEPTPEERLNQLVDAGIEVMSLEDKVAGLFLVTPESITGVNTAVKAGNGTKNALTKYSVGGIVYSSKNIQSAAQFKEMIETTRMYSNYPLFIAMEDEGGSGSPLASKGLVTKQKNAKEIADSGDAAGAYASGSAIGEYLASYGVNLNFAPLADLNSVENSILAKRAYGTDAAATGEYVTNMVNGMKSQKVNTCLKYFPGLGSTTQDPANGLSSTARTAEEFRAGEFVVYRTGIEAGADMIMVGHMSAPALAGDNTPCSMSEHVVTDILRKELNFDGVIITDSMSKKAISDYYGADEAAVLALKAGCDMILMPENFEKAYNGVLEAVKSGVISEERINDALRRVYRIKYADRLEELSGGNN